MFCNKRLSIVYYHNGVHLPMKCNFNNSLLKLKIIKFINSIMYVCLQPKKVHSDLKINRQNELQRI